MARPDYIAIEGPIGVGKTSLARKLADYFDAELLLEGADRNPFLERFYKDPKNAALPTQLFFLFQRAQQMQDIEQDDLFTSARIADFMFEKDRLFAELTLTRDELALYDQVYEKLEVETPRPDLVIYLQAPTSVLKERIAIRAIQYEQTMGADYLDRIAEAYTRLFYNYDDSPLLIINAQHIDWVNNQRDFEMLVDEIKAIEYGRHFFNPGVGQL